MRLSWTSEVPGQGPLREQWNALVLQMKKPEVFFTWEWASAVARAYGDVLSPWIATAYEGDELVGVAALAKPSSREAVFLAGTTADYCDFISRPVLRQEFARQVLRDLKKDGVRRVTLANLPADSATIAGLRGNGCFYSYARTAYVCAQVRLGSEEERQMLVQSLMKKKMLRRALNSLERAGPASLRHECGMGLRDASLNAFFPMHVARFLSMGRISNLVAPERRRFLVELARLLGEREWIDLMSLCVGNRVLAYNYGFRFHGSWFWYQPTLDNEFEELSPGFCLLAKIVEDACRHPEVQEVDLGLGAEGYKERFANAQRTTLHVTLCRSVLKSWLAGGRFLAAESIKKRRKLESIARRAQWGMRRGQQRVAEHGLVRTLVWAGRRLRRTFASKDEVRLFRWQGDGQTSEQSERLVPLSWEILAAAAMRYAQDRETLDYLLRSSERFRSATHRGYALLVPNGVAMHFAWVAPYEGFAMAELQEILRAPSPESVMIFDCWTPRELRGRGLYGRAVQQLATLLRTEGKEAWIFSAAANPASLAGLGRTGFESQFSLVRRKILWWARTWTKQSTEYRSTASPKPAVPTSPYGE